MANLEDTLFRLKFTAKSLKKQSMKSGREVESLKKQIKTAIQQQNDDIAKLHASTATRKKNEQLNLLKLAARVDSVASRVQTAITMRQLTGNMATVVKGMDKALQSMNTENISVVMDKFEQQFEDMDASAQYYESATQNTSVLDTPQEEVDLLLQQVADDAGIEFRRGLQTSEVPQKQKQSNAQIEDTLEERLRALRE